jgi:hypothetical protein
MNIYGGLGSCVIRLITLQAVCGGSLPGREQGFIPSIKRPYQIWGRLNLQFSWCRELFYGG